MIKHVNEKNFNEEVINKKGVYLIDFYANWCGPCMMLSPVLEEIASSRAGYNILKVNVDENQNLTMDMGIDTIPTICIYKDGELQEKHIGYKSKEEVLKVLEKYV